MLFAAVVVLVVATILVGGQLPNLTTAEIAVQPVNPEGPDGKVDVWVEQVPTLPPLPTPRKDASNRPQEERGPRVGASPEKPPKVFAKDWTYLNAIGNIVEMDFGDGTGRQVQRNVPFESPEGEKGTVVEIKPFHRIVVVRRDSDGETFEVPKAVIGAATDETAQPDLDVLLDRYEQVTKSMSDDERDEFQKGMDALSKYDQRTDKANEIQEYETKLLEYERMKGVMTDEKKQAVLEQLSGLRNLILLGIDEANETPFDTRQLDSMTPEQRKAFLQRLNTLLEIQKRVSQ